MEQIDYKLILEQLISLMDEGVYIVDKDGIGIFYNDAMAEIERINVDDVVGTEYHKAFPGVKLQDSTMFQALKKGVSTRNKQQSYLNLYGREVTTVNSTVPVRDGTETVAAIEVAKDITDIRNMSDTILELQEKKIEPEKPKRRSSIRRYNFNDLIGRAAPRSEEHTSELQSR